MGTEILRPQDCLIERIRVPPAAFCRRRSSYGNYDSNICNNYNPRSNRKSVARSERPERPEQRKRFVPNHSEPSVSKRSSSDDLKAMKNSLVMEKVTILRRGESLDSKIKSEALKKEGDNIVVCGTDRLGPAPETVAKQIRIVDVRSPIAGKADVYAGSAFSMSPSPSSLPLPSFSKKKHVSAIVDDSATRDLRRLLRLDA
ncbi:uncharacterized protein LOC101217755 [Cucumis sativus]|uniref:Uncharacterized protein n=1 Tax=Cucumis sativus TaxID=3659 RepID=A0A0A0KCP9_CUCSA|nr:uncharacterized protein LOC101217755 [Cucumis sativus]KGN46172.1 hypothetical protein Csa_005412 [Cucumis sativus]